MLERLVVLAEKLSRIAVWVGGGLVIAAAGLVTVDVIARKLFNFSFAGADEISGYVFAISTAFAFSYCLLNRANVRIDSIYNLLPARLLGWLDLLGLVLLAVFAFMVTWRAALFTMDSYEFWSKSITPLQTPLAIPQSLWLAGLVLFCVVLLLLILATGHALVRGDLHAVQKLAGVRTRDEEMQQELGAARDSA